MTIQSCDWFTGYSSNATLLSYQAKQSKIVLVYSTKRRIWIVQYFGELWLQQKPISSSSLGYGFNSFSTQIFQFCRIHWSTVLINTAHCVYSMCTCFMSRKLPVFLLISKFHYPTKSYLWNRSCYSKRIVNRSLRDAARCINCHDAPNGVGKSNIILGLVDIVIETLWYPKGKYVALSFCIYHYFT